MNILIINPHRSDFIFDSVAYKLLGRRSLKKYKYIQKFIFNNTTFFYFETSSFYNFLRKLRLTFLDIFFLKFEIKYFLRINKLENIKIFKKKNNTKFDVVYCFGFSIRTMKFNDLKLLAKNSKSFIIHLSHYHLYADKINEWSKLDNVKFCSDTNLTNNYFYNYFLDTKPKHFILSYIIDNKYVQTTNWDERINKIISTGTFHEFEKIFKKKELSTSLISGYFNSLSLHPERRIVNLYSHKIKHLDSFNSSMGDTSIFNKISKINQKNYFKNDIVALYNKYKYAFVGEESIIGIPGIGIFEAILCGCLPIINKSMYNGTPLENSNLALNYNNINELINILIDFKPNFSITFHINDFKVLQNEIRMFFSEKYQLEQLYKNLSNDIYENFTRS